ncbi:MAG: hypothetical protein KF784_03970 [Fimbriimonadaceae bacterium]|nr:hypothetical protein [Fimbriimonadaceae bacterium]
MKKLMLIGAALAAIMTVAGCGTPETDAGKEPDPGTKTSDTPNLPDQPAAAPNE